MRAICAWNRSLPRADLSFSANPRTMFFKGVGGFRIDCRPRAELRFQTPIVTQSLSIHVRPPKYSNVG